MLYVFGACFAHGVSGAEFALEWSVCVCRKVHMPHSILLMLIAVDASVPCVLDGFAIRHIFFATVAVIWT